MRPRSVVCIREEERSLSLYVLGALSLRRVGLAREGVQRQRGNMPDPSSSRSDRGRMQAGTVARVGCASQSAAAGIVSRGLGWWRTGGGGEMGMGLDWRRRPQVLSCGGGLWEERSVGGKSQLAAEPASCQPDQTLTRSNQNMRRAYVRRDLLSRNALSLSLSQGMIMYKAFYDGARSSNPHKTHCHHGHARRDLLVTSL